MPKPETPPRASTSRGHRALRLLIAAQMAVATIGAAAAAQSSATELWSTCTTDAKGQIVLGPMYQDLERHRPATKAGDRVMVVDNRRDGHPALIQTDPQRCATLQLVDGRPVLRFDGVDDYYAADVALDVSHYDVWLRHRLTAPPRTCFESMVSGSDGSKCDYDDNGFYFLAMGYGRSTAQNLMHLAHLRRDGANESMFVEGLLLASASRDKQGRTRQICVGARFAPNAMNYVPMDVETLAMATGLDAESAHRVDLELAVAPDRPRIVCAGDSITDGSMGDAGVRPTEEYPCFVGAEHPDFLVINSGNWGCEIANLYPVDDYFVPGSWLVVLAGSNDCTKHREPTQIYEDLAAYCKTRKALGWKVVVCTLLPRDFNPAGSGDPNDFEQRRTTVNDLLRKNHASFADAFADLGADARIGAKGAERNPQYFQPDLVHLAVGGTRAVAELVLKELPKSQGRAIPGSATVKAAPTSKTRTR